MPDPAFGATRTLGDALRGLAMIATPSPPSQTLGDEASPFGRIGEHRTFRGGDQWLFKFANGYGASVVRHSGSYGSEDGLWELAVLDSAGNLTYSTPITDDVIGRLTEDEAASLLNNIEELS